MLGEAVLPQPVSGVIGILGGSFDPVHIGHLRLAIELTESFAIEELRLLPNATPNLRAAPVLTGEQRLELLRAATASLPRIGIDDRELRRGGVSYSIDTLRELRAENPATCLLFVLGMDAFAGLDRWREWPEILNYVHLLVATRPDATLPRTGAVADLLRAAQTEDPAALLRVRHGRVLIHRIPLLSIAATDIRARISAGRRIDFLVPDAVRAIISREGWYRTAVPNK